MFNLKLCSTNISHDTANLKILINTLVDRKNKKDRDCRLGFVNVDLDQFKHGQTIDQWFPIQPPTTSAKSPSSTIKCAPLFVFLFLN